MFGEAIRRTHRTLHKLAAAVGAAAAGKALICTIAAEGALE
jgi:hypothetical protein